MPSRSVLRTAPAADESDTGPPGDDGGSGSFSRAGARPAARPDQPVPLAGAVEAVLSAGALVAAGAEVSPADPADPGPSVPASIGPVVATGGAVDEEARVPVGAAVSSSASAALPPSGPALLLGVAPTGSPVSVVAGSSRTTSRMRCSNAV